MIEVVIDQLVIGGLSASEAQTAAAALEARLAWLARDGDVAPRSEAFLRAEPIRAPTGNPAALGGAVAAAVWSAVHAGDGR